MLSLENKTAFITGASSGIGQACARVMAQAGANLILAARREDRVHALTRELQTEHKVACYAGRLDVREPRSVERFVSDLPGDFREIDILVNNAGLARGMDPIHQGRLEDWEEMIDTNIKNR